MIQIYYGDGKGKTTAAIGQGVRAVGAGLTVFMIQFLKTYPSAEMEALRSLGERFRLFRFEHPHGFTFQLTEEERLTLKKDVQEAVAFAGETIAAGSADVLILDEILGAVREGLVEEETLLTIMENCPRNMELILTGRPLTERIAEKADYVTEMQKKKHPMDQGVSARKGIEF